MMFISVDLPEPDGPMIATYSFSVDVERDAGQRAHLLLAHVVGLDDVPQRRALLSALGSRSHREGHSALSSRLRLRLVGDRHGRAVDQVARDRAVAAGDDRLALVDPAT